MLINTHLLDIIDITRCMNAVATGVTVQNGTGVNMAGADGVLFVAAVGTLTATQVTSLKAQGSSDDGAGDAYADIAGAETPAFADADSNKLAVLDVRNPAEQYVRPVVVRGTAGAVIDGVVAVRYKLRDIPSTQPASVAVSAKKIVN